MFWVKVSWRNGQWFGTHMLGGIGKWGMGNGDEQGRVREFGMNDLGSLPKITVCTLYSVLCTARSPFSRHAVVPCSVDLVAPLLQHVGDTCLSCLLSGSSILGSFDSKVANSGLTVRCVPSHVWPLSLKHRAFEQ